MIKSNGWMNTLVTLVVIATPALIGFYLMFPEWRDDNNFSYYWYWIVAIGFMLYASLAAYVFIKTKVLAYDAIAFMIPVALVLSALFVTAKMDISEGANIAIRVIVGVLAMLSAIPMNILVTKLKYRKIDELKKIQKRNLKRK